MTHKRKAPLPRITGRDMPCATSTGRNNYPFRYMLQGDSFAADPNPEQPIQSLACSIRTCALRFVRSVEKRIELRFETHVITEDGRKRVRCWRVQ